MQTRRRKSAGISSGQEKITKFVLRSRIPSKVKDDEVKTARTGIGVRKKSPTPASRSRRSDNGSSVSDGKAASETKTTGRSFGAPWNRVAERVRPEDACLDPYDFDTFLTEYDQKENSRPKSKGKRGPPRKNPRSPKPKSRKAIKKKHAGDVIIIFPKKTSGGGDCNTKSAIVDSPSEKLSSIAEPEVVRRERHFDESSNVHVESPESILGGLLDVCKKQKMANKHYETSVSLFQDPDSFPLAGTPFSTKEKTTDQECCTSTPQTCDAALEPFGLSSCEENSNADSQDDDPFGNTGISPIRKAPREHLQAVDLNGSGFSAEKNCRTYRRHANPKMCQVVALAPEPVVKKSKKKCEKRRVPKKKKKQFDKWATSANETLIEAENFELVIE